MADPVSPLWLILQNVEKAHQPDSALPGFAVGDKCQCGAPLGSDARLINHVLREVYVVLGRTLGNARIQYRAEEDGLDLDDWEGRDKTAIAASGDLSTLNKIIDRGGAGLVGAYRLVFHGEWTRF